MHDEVRPGFPRWDSALLVLLALLPVRAEAATTTAVGELTGTYNHLENYTLTQNGDGTFGRARQSSTYWGQNYRAGFSTQLGVRTLLYAELRYTDVSYTDGSRRATTPTGLLRLTAPVYGLTASYRPARRTTQTLTTGAPGDTTASLGTAELLTRNYDLDLSGYVAPAHLPRFEGQWLQRHQYATSTAPAATGLQRSLNAIQDFRGLTLRAGYADQARRASGETQVQRRTYTAGAAYATTFAGANPLRLDYGYQQGETPGHAGDVTNYTHSLNGASAYRLSARSAFDGGGFYNSSLVKDGSRQTVTSYDVYAYHRYSFSAATQSRVGGGQRSSQGRVGTQPSPYLLASLTSDGIPRPGWRARAGLSHSTEWLPRSAPSSSEALNLGSAFDFSRTFSLRADLQSTVRHGTVVNTAGRCGSTATAGMLVVPLRSTTIQVDATFQGYGPNPVSLPSRSSTESASLMWRPNSRTNLLAQRSISGNLPHNSPKTYGTTLTASWRPTPAVQFDGTYSNWGGNSSTVPGISSDTESFGLRMAYRLTRRLSTNAGYQQANRGRPTESTMLNVSASYRFDL